MSQVNAFPESNQSAMLHRPETLRSHITRFLSEYFLFRSKLKSLFAWSLILWIAIIIRNPYYTADLENIYTDHLRFEYTSWAFLQVGFKVFSVPLTEIVPVVNALSPHLYWQVHPLLNPLGTVFYFLPFGIASNLGILSDVVVHKLMILSFLVAGYLCVYHFTLDWNKDKPDLITYILLPLIFYISSVYWALNGFFDVVPIFLIILSVQAYKRNDFFKVVVLLAVAMFMHYRSLVYAPLLACSFLMLWKKEGMASGIVRKAIASSVVLAIGLFDGYTFYLTFIRKLWITPAVWAPSSAYILDSQNLYFVIFFLVATLGVCFYLLRKRNVLASIMLIFFWIYISFIGSWGSWHLLFFFPAILLLTEKRTRESFSIWLLISMFLLGGIITPVQLASPVGRMSPQYLNVTITIVGEGSTAPSGGNYSNVYLDGQNLNVRAFPASGWRYEYMKRNGVIWTSSNPGTFLNLHGNITVEVVFVPIGG
jgi:hypothetical protein